MPFENSSDDMLLNNILTEANNFFMRYVLLVSVCFGAIGNTFSLCVFWLRRDKDRVSSAYLGPLAFFDLWNVGNGFQQWLVQGAAYVTNGALGLDHYGSHKWECVGVVFSNMYAMYLSGWTIVIFTVERALVVHFPFKMAAQVTVWKRRRALIVMAVFGFFAHLITLTSEPLSVQGKNICPPSPKYPKYLVYFFWFLHDSLNVAIPCILLAILNAWIIYGVFKNRNLTKHAQNTNEQRCLKNLIVVSTAYFIFASPWAVFWNLRLTEFGSKSEVVGALTLFSLSWINLNFSINPVLYTWSLPFYRQFLFDLFCRKREK